MNTRLEGALSALLFSEGWFLGWRPGDKLPLGGLGQLALRRVHIGLEDDLEPMPHELVPALIVAPLWLGTRPAQQVKEPEPVPTFLHLIERVRSWRRGESEGRGVSLAAHLLETPEPRSRALLANAQLVEVLGPYAVADAARALPKLDRIWDRDQRLRPHAQGDVYKELVLALLACQAAACNLAASLARLDEARAPELAYAAAGLLCEARHVLSVPSWWLRDLQLEQVDALAAACRDKDEGPAGTRRTS